MKHGRSIVELAQEIQRQAETKKDMHVIARALTMYDSCDIGIHDNKLGGVFEATDLAHRQLGAKLGIPAKYYDKMRMEQPTLLAENINTWLGDIQDTFLVRMLGGDIRAILSKGYCPLDNIDLAEAILPVLPEHGLDVLSAEITENKLYIKAVTPELTAEITKGDVVQSGICISNSEVGLGSLSIQPLVYRLVCSNGMIANDYGMRRNHVGRRHVASHDVSEFYRDATKKADDKAFWMKVQDTVAATLKQVTFDKIVNSMREATERELTGDPVKAIESLGSKFDFNENERGSILKHLITGGSLSQYAVANAVTRAAQDVDSYDRSTELEQDGYSIIQLSERDWRVVNAA